MNEKVIVWDADQREIPGHGVISRGDVKSLPEHLATSFIYQGLATPQKVKVKLKEQDK